MLNQTPLGLLGGYCWPIVSDFADACVRENIEDDLIVGLQLDQGP